MTLLHDIKNNTIIYYISYSDVYQYESENEDLYQEIICLDWNQTKRNAETLVYTTHEIINI